MRRLIGFFIKLEVLFLILIFFISVWLNDLQRNRVFISEESKNSVINKEPGEKRISLIMVGDSLIHGAVWQDAKTSDGKYNFYKMIDLVKPIIKKHDLAFYNQESILGGISLRLSDYPRFNSPQEVGDAFIDAGFNLVSLANNHTLDRGESAIKASNKYWSTKQNVITAGSYTSFEERDKLIIKEKNGITYALLSYTTLTNGIKVPKGKEYLVDVYSNEKAKKDIEKYRDKVDLLLVSIHWGQEYKHKPNQKQKDIAKFLADNKVDIVIGHHPHVVQPVEFINDTMVIYSLGNFLSSQRGINKLTGLMMSVEIIKKGDEKIRLENPKAEITYNYNSGKINSKRNYEVYPYGQLNNKILPDYEKHYQTYMSIVVSMSDKIEKIYKR